MRRIATLAWTALALVPASPGQARDDRLRMPLADALATEAAKQKIDPKIQLYFGDQPHPKPLQDFGTATANRKTNFFNKSDKEGCEWVFLSSVLSLQERARKLGANAVVNIRSVYRGGDLSSATEYECGAGTFIGGVALEGQFVKLP
jgi:hypothetical protein